MQLRNVNPRRQGDIGVAHAIAWFADHGYKVLVPLSESQRYDLVVEDPQLRLMRVQVKTTTCRLPNSRYQVSLRTKGGNRSGQRTQLFDPLAIDLLFVLTETGERSLFPTAEMANVNSIIVCGPRSRPYQV